MFGLSKNEKLLKAVAKGDLSRVKKLIEEMGVHVDTDMYDGKSLLYLALVNKQKEVADYLMQTEETIWPMVRIAISENNMSVLKELIEGQNLNVNYQPNENDATALHLAAQYGHLEMVQYLVEQGADVSAVCKIARYDRRIWAYQVEYYRPIEMTKNKEVYKFLKKCVSKTGYKFRKPEDVISKCDPTNICSHIPLQPSLRKVREESVTPVQEQAEQTVSDGTTDKENFSLLNPEKALFLAVKEGDLERVKLLIEKYKVDVNEGREGCYITPLYVAIENKHEDVADYLAQYDDAITATLDAAIEWNNFPVLKKLVERYNFNVNYQRRVQVYTPLHKAVIWDRLEMVRYLVEKGADISAVRKIARYDRHIQAYQVEYLRPINKARGVGVREFLKNCARKTGYKYARPLPTTQQSETLAINDSGIPVQTSVRVVPDAAAPVNQEQQGQENTSISLGNANANASVVVSGLQYGEEQLTQTGNTTEATPKQTEQTDPVGTTDENVNPMDEMKKLACVQMISETLSKCDEAQLQQVYETIAPKMDKATQQKIATLFKGESAGK